MGLPLEEIFIAHRIIAGLLSDELEEPVYLLDRVPVAAPAGCIVPLCDLHREAMWEFGEDS
ncbi:MAG: hypothetical protein ROY82_06775 [Truepera sp.]|jgi:hypothetical protein|nr:hypothetical protein [Truepera sp.]